MSAGPLQRSAIVDAAVEAAGVSELGDDDWVEPLDRLIDSLHHDAHLSEIGVHVANGTLVNSLRSRLLILDWHERHPDLAASEVAAPIVILGQPRTGTTILFDLLAQDPALRAPLTWEVSEPIPPPRTETYANDPRIEVAAAASGLAESLTPGFQAIHPSGPTRGQECVAMMAASMRSIQFSIAFRVPTYSKWLFDEADPEPMYRIHKQYLQVLQSEHSADRWVLKTPAHQWWLPALYAAYPDATAVHTHRDPLKVIASVSSLGASLRRMGMDDPSAPDVAQEWAGYLLEGNERSIVAREDATVPEGQIVDLHFAELMRDTFATLAGLYERLGRDFTAAAESAMRGFLDDNPRDKHGRHTYSFEETELDEADLRAQSRRYSEYFGVADEEL